MDQKDQRIAKASESQGCPYCGCTDTAQGPGKGPHYASLICISCGGHLKWLAKPKSRAAPAGKITSPPTSG